MRPTPIFLIRSDLYRYIGTWHPGPARFLRSYLTIPGFRYSFWLRLTNYFATSRRLRPLFYLSRLCLARFSYKYGIDIPYNTSIGRGFYIGHFSCIVVAPDAVIGNNVNVSQGVTIGVASRGPRAGAAIIGDDVYIGPGAKIVGKVLIGANAAIGANAVVTKDIPPGAVAVGIPAKVVSAKGASEYILNKA